MPRLPTDPITLLFERRSNAEWGNIGNLSERAIAELGVEGAISEKGRPSPRRSSSGKTSSIQRAAPEGAKRKTRQAHYTRKAILEKEKEAVRRAVWERRHPGSSESKWKKMEEARKARKAANRTMRKKRSN